SGDTKEDILVTFTATTTDAVLAWGGHIAQGREAGLVDWGTVGTGEFGAGNINGSPYHMALNSGSSSTIGNTTVTAISSGSQDLSLKSSVVVVPAINIEKLVSADGGANWYLFNDNDHETSSGTAEDD